MSSRTNDESTLLVAMVTAVNIFLTFGEIKVVRRKRDTTASLSQDKTSEKSNVMCNYSSLTRLYTNSTHGSTNFICLFLLKTLRSFLFPVPQ